ncbi:GH92 family glycosyl hydrolase [Streptacidiphilus sp. MAP12-33]|uniref:GH92 family glycosyl hydrolase n=1 Tax=Streptacidiphilus sp. MAP12-33 TaxID=3156266 RepID=UPI0035190412
MTRVYQVRVAVAAGTAVGLLLAAGIAPAHSVPRHDASATKAGTARGDDAQGTGEPGLSDEASAEAAAESDADADPTAFVDPFVGTGSGGRWVGRIDTFPGATVPFGMVQWSPDTPSRPDGGGYAYADRAIRGFSLTHLSGPGCPIAGDMPVLPLAGPAPARPESVTVPLDHRHESARPGAYTVTTAGVRTELSATTRTGAARFTFPRGASSGVLLVNAAGGATATSGASLRVVDDRHLVGRVTSGHFCGSPHGTTMYVAFRFDRPFRAALWPASHHGPVPGATLTFDTRRDPFVGLQVGLSYVDAAGAERNLDAEARTWDVHAVAAAARALWRDTLDAIRVSAGGRARRVTFYTALYHSLLHPSTFSDADGRYRGFDGGVHSVAPGHVQYADISGWDVYRCQVPLLAWLFPTRADDLAASLLADADQGGWLPKWPYADGYTGVMNGDPADSILAEIQALGDQGFDAGHALQLMVHGAEDVGGPRGQGWYTERPDEARYLQLGYVPNDHIDSTAHVHNGASTTLEYAVADFAVSRLAAAVGDADTAGRFRDRSRNWHNLFDPATGYLRPRDAAGAFPRGPALDLHDGRAQDGFQEGNAAQYLWMVPHDLPALVDTLGGAGAVNARLDRYFTQLNAGPGRPYHWQGNEPGFGTPWLYDSTGLPARTQDVVRAIADRLYRATPDGEPGNDDLGALSSWYVWAALGLYPQTPGTTTLALSTPLFPHIVIHRPGRDDLVLATHGTGPHIAALTRDGTNEFSTWTDALSTDRLDFTLTRDPSPSWGTDPSDAPPAYP